MAEEILKSCFKNQLSDAGTVLSPLFFFNIFTFLDIDFAQE